MKSYNYYWDLLGAFIFVAISGLIHYLTQTEFGISGIIFASLFGGAITMLGRTKHTSFIKNLVFGSVFLYFFWLLFTPVSDLGGSWIIKQNEIWTIVFLGIMFFDRELWNVLGTIRHQKPTWALTAIGNLALIIWLSKIGAFGKIFEAIAPYWYLICLFVIANVTWMTVLAMKGLKRSSRQIVRSLK